MKSKFEINLASETALGLFISRNGIKHDVIFTFVQDVIEDTNPDTVFFCRTVEP